MADAATGSRRRRWPRIVAVLAVILLVLVALAAIRIVPLLNDGKQYASIVSVEARPDFRDPALLRAAWALPVAARYKATPFEYQDNPSYCGPASAAAVLRSMGRPANQHAAIDGTRFEPWSGILLGGLTLDEEAELLRLRTGTPVEVVRGLTLAEFRTLIARANQPGTRIIANFHRGPLFARGHGHFSPVLGYLPGRDLVFVGDVNRDYRPYLVPSERLWRGITTIDDSTGKLRGLLIVAVPAKIAA